MFPIRVQVLLRGIFEATEVKTPTTFIILDEVLPPELSKKKQDQLLSLKDDGSGIELTGDAKAAKDRFDKGVTWLKRLKTFGEGVIENNPSKLFGKIQEVFGELMTKETMYFYLVDELTGLPVRGDGYPIEITTPAEIVPKLLPVMHRWACAPCRSTMVSRASRRWSATPCRRCPRGGARVHSPRSRCSSRCVSYRGSNSITLCPSRPPYLSPQLKSEEPHCDRRRRALSRSSARCTPKCKMPTKRQSPRVARRCAS